VHQPIRERGRKVGELLVNPDSAEGQILLPIELIIRSSTGPSSGSFRSA
jgi:DNA-binding LacI/PurR family transcriptional regulator